MPVLEFYVANGRAVQRHQVHTNGNYTFEYNLGTGQVFFTHLPRNTWRPLGNVAYISIYSCTTTSSFTCDLEMHSPQPFNVVVSRHMYNSISFKIQLKCCRFSLGSSAGTSLLWCSCNPFILFWDWVPAKCHNFWTRRKDIFRLKCHCAHQSHFNE